ncbi:WG repeat-containing protein [Edaphovirga cremea]|uniref:WG repeat-containing protein n=1 Tax=Edaphovirga cremea TaxID=2267246 RepID=UPI003989CBF2
MKYTLRKTLQNGGLVTLLALAQQASAEDIATGCSVPETGVQAVARARLALPGVVNICIRDIHQGRAAVLLPSAEMAIDDAALAPQMFGHRWGFLDEKGQLVIKPVFEQASDYHYGLAAVSQNGKWGYIDVSGNWAIEPQFSSAGDFTELGIAAVTREGRPQLINRSGAPVGQPLDERVSSLLLEDGNPLRLRLEYKTVFLSPDGTRHFASDQMEIVQPFGHEGMFVARNSEQGYGIVDQNLNWRIEPSFSAITVPPGKYSLARAEQGDRVSFIRADGSLVEKTYRSAEPLTSSLWLAKNDQDKTVLLDSVGNELQSLDGSAASKLGIHDEYVLNSDKDAVKVYLSGFKGALSIPANSVASAQDTAPFLMTRSGEQGKINSIIAPDGQMIGGMQQPNWLAQIDNSQVINGRLWLRDGNGKLLNIVDQHGKALLSQKTLGSLQNGRLQPLFGVTDQNQRMTESAIPLGMLVSDNEGAGLLRADGSLMLDAKWSDIQLADGADSDADRNAPLQFIVKTKTGSGLIDSLGKQLVPFEQDNISPYVHGFAFAYRDGKLNALDHQGNHFDLPNVFELESIGGGWFRYRETAAEDALWGIYDVVSQKIVIAPSLTQVGSVNEGAGVSSGQTSAQLPDGKWGVIDGNGQWVIAAKFSKVERINSALWIVTLAAPEGTEPANQDVVQRAIIGTDGKQRIAVSAGLTGNRFSDGRILATAADGQSWLLSADGQLQLSEEHTGIRAMGDWVRLSRLPQEGYINAQGEWQIPSDSNWQTSAFVNGHALRAGAQNTEIIDTNGVKVGVLPEGQWFWPAASDLAFSTQTNDGKSVTRYADASGKIVLTVDGQGSRLQDGRAVLSRSAAEKTWIDLQGHATDGVAFQDLGLPSDGLAFAQTANRYGFIDAQGNFVIAPVFSAVSPFDSGVAIVSDDNVSMMIDRSGKPLARVDRECGIQVLYGTGAVRQWPPKMPVRCEQ